MPVYFIDFFDGSASYRDDIGSELQDVQQARQQALDLFRQVGLDKLLALGSGAAVVTVRDLDGTVVFSATLTLE